MHELPNTESQCELPPLGCCWVGSIVGRTCRRNVRRNGRHRGSGRPPHTRWRAVLCRCSERVSLWAVHTLGRGGLRPQRQAVRPGYRPGRQRGAAVREARRLPSCGGRAVGG